MKIWIYKLGNVFKTTKEKPIGKNAGETFEWDAFRYSPMFLWSTFYLWLGGVGDFKHEQRIEIMRKLNVELFEAMLLELKDEARLQYLWQRKDV